MERGRFRRVPNARANGLPPAAGLRPASRHDERLGETSQPGRVLSVLPIVVTEGLSVVLRRSGSTAGLGKRPSNPRRFISRV
jgi:hypothetical protein